MTKTLRSKSSSYASLGAKFWPTSFNTFVVLRAKHSFQDANRRSLGFSAIALLLKELKKVAFAAFWHLRPISG